ncbi:MAG: hypothetical protein U1D96_05465 [Eubacteriales bacterium]|nr:hypothetical protein [Clostridia bacterium]MDZ4042929.1 hypothetical protein [Eubacteriales bacterium]
MIIVEKNQGDKAAYELQGNVLAFRGGELALDLSMYERDFPVHIDICCNEYDMLVVGLGRRYVAAIDIPARAYDAEQTGDPENPITLAPRAFDISKAQLTLWAL